MPYVDLIWILIQRNQKTALREIENSRTDWALGNIKELMFILLSILMATMVLNVCVCACAYTYVHV